MAKKKERPPAKIKYDKSHPIVSVRLTPDLKLKLDLIKKMSDKSIADILKEAVGLQTASAKAAYNKGYLTAQIKFEVDYPCSVCGKMLQIDTADEKKAAAQFMRDNGWRYTASALRAKIVTINF